MRAIDTPSKPPLSPLLENARRHGRCPGDVALAGLTAGDCVAVLAPVDAPHTIAVRVTRIISTTLDPVDRLVRIPAIIEGIIEPDQTWGDLFRPGNPAYQAGALIRFHSDNVAAVY